MIKSIQPILFALCIHAIGMSAHAKETQHPETSIPASLFFEKANISEYVFSADGQYLAFIKRLAPGYTLQIMDVEQLEIIHTTPIGRDSPRRLTWIGSSYLIYTAPHRLMRINKDGTDAHSILENLDTNEEIYDRRSLLRALKNHYTHWELLGIASNNEEILVSSLNAGGYSDVFRVNLYTGERTAIASGKKQKISRWFVGANGEAVLGLGATKEKLEFFIKDPATHTFILHDALQENNALRLNREGGSYIGTRIIPNALSYDNDILYVTENINRDKFQISEYSLAQKKIIKTLHEDADYDVGSFAENPDLLFNHTEKKLIGVRYLKSKIHTEWFDQRFLKIQTALDRQYPDTINIMLRWTDDLKNILFYQQYSNNHGKTYLYIPDKNKFELLNDDTQKLNAYKLPSKQTIRFKSRDHVEHEAYLTLPNAYAGQPLPAIVIPHGGPWDRFYLEYTPDALFFASRGYAVLEVNYRGSTGYGRKYLLDGIKELAGIMLDDIADSAKWLIAEDYADPDRIFILGASYGGYAALMSTIQYPGLYKAAVALAPPLNLIAQMEHYAEHDQQFAYEFWKTAVGDIRKEKETLKKISPYFRMNELKTPFLIFQGQNDPIVPVIQIQEFIKKFGGTQNRTGVFKVIPNEGHGFAIQSNNAYFVEQALAHFKKAQNSKAPH